MIDTVAALSHPIPLEPVEQAQVVSGTPLVGVVTLGMIGDKEYGVWEMSPGSMSDVETDEVCVILAGAATVEFVDGERTVRAIAAAGFMSTFDVCRIVVQFLEARVLRRRP